jgi:HK97 family phage prohead protease
MSKDTEIITRQAGEAVSVFAHLEPSLTKDLGEGVIEATVSTNATDHHNESINIDGVNTDTYHGTVLYGHDAQGLPIGKTISMTKSKNKLKAKFQMAIQEYPFAKTVYDLIKGGYLTDVSIGGIVDQWSADYSTIEKMTMKEFSVVPIGANHQAMITSKSFGDVTLDQISKEYEQFVRGAMLDKVSAMGEDDINQAIKVLDNLLATLKHTAQTDVTGESQPTEIKRIKRIRLIDSAKALNRESERLIKVIKLK